MAKPKNYTEMIGKEVGSLIVLRTKVVSISYLVCKCKKTGKLINVLPKNFIAKNRRILSDLSDRLSLKEKVVDLSKKSNHPMYGTYMAMKFRCYSPAQISYKYYGARGITVCDRWLNSFDNFILDVGEKPSKNHQLDRINNDGNYEPSNCRWATRSEQMRNTRKRTPRTSSTG